MTRTTFGKLALLFAMVGALALAGCGGGSDGESGPAGMSGAVGPQGPAGAKGDPGEMGPAGPAGPAGPQGEPGMDGVDGMAGPAGPAGEKGDPGEMGAQGPAGPAGPAGEDGAPGDSVALGEIWESIAGDAIANYLDMMVGTGARTVTEVRAAIAATATKYGVDATSALAHVDDSYPQHETLRAAEVESLLMALHAGGHLAATSDAVAEVLMGPAGPMGAAGANGEDGEDGAAATVAEVWQAIAGDAIMTALDASFGTTGARTVAQLNAAIRATAMTYGLDPTSALDYLNTLHTVTDSIHRDEVDALADSIGMMLAAMANRDSVVAVIVAAIPGDGDGNGNGNGNGDGDGDMPMGIAAVLAMDGVTATNGGEASDFALPDGTTFENEGNGIESFTASVGANYGDLGDDDFADHTYETMGLWADGVAGFVVLSNERGVVTVNVETAVLGVPVDAPTGLRVRAYWFGNFTGIHTEDPGTAFDPAEATAAQMVGVYDSVMGDVRLDVTADDAGDAAMMTATFDGFVPGEDAYEHEITGINIQRRGNFSGGASAGGRAHELEGQFYEAGNGINVGGSVALINAHASNAGEGAVGIGSNTAANSHYNIKGVFVATE